MSTQPRSIAPISITPDPLTLPLSRRLLAFAFLLLAEFFYSWSWNTVDVLRPLIRQSLNLSLTAVGSAYSAQSAGALVGAIVIAQLADRFGRRNLLGILMAGYGASLLLGAAVHTYPQLLAQRLLLGVFLGGSFPVVVGIYVGLFHPTVRGRLASAINACFSTAIITLGFAFGHLGHHDWRLLLLAGGLPPLILSAFARAIIPASPPSTIASSKLPASELFAPGLRRQTLLLASLTGLNFFSYQAFSGWLTTYLRDTRHLDPLTIGHLISLQFFGNILGGFFWGWAGDRLGRRFGALGFFITAASIVAYLLTPSSLLPLLLALGLLFGFALSCSVVWGPWLAELYPPHLRSTASSIFNWGRLVSFFAPLITGAVAGRFGFRSAMLLGAGTFVIAAFIWLSLPETLRRQPSQLTS